MFQPYQILSHSKLIDDSNELKEQFINNYLRFYDCQISATNPIIYQESRIYLALTDELSAIDHSNALLIILEKYIKILEHCEKEWRKNFSQEDIEDREEWTFTYCNKEKYQTLLRICKNFKAKFFPSNTEEKLVDKKAKNQGLMNQLFCCFFHMCPQKKDLLTSRRSYGTVNFDALPVPREKLRPSHKDYGTLVEYELVTLNLKNTP